MYDEGLIDDTFTYDYTEEQGFGFAVVGGDTSNPDELSAKIRKIMLSSKNQGITSEELERVKKKKLALSFAPLTHLIILQISLHDMLLMI